MSKSMNDRLRAARERAGFPNAKAAAEAFDWNITTYRSHENGTRGIPLEVIESYARAFNAAPCWLAFGIASPQAQIAGTSPDVLQEILLLVLENPHTKNASPEVIAKAVLDVCAYVQKSGSSGLSNVVDFRLFRASQAQPG